jgi:hypothetical protein
VGFPTNLRIFERQLGSEITVFTVSKEIKTSKNPLQISPNKDGKDLTEISHFCKAIL